MSNALVRHQQNGAALAPTTGGMDIMTLGQTLAASGYFKDARDAAQAVVKVLFGQEIGIGPVSAMMGIHIIEGKPAPSANLIAARIKASGRYDYRVREHSGERCRIEFFERSAAGWEPLGMVEWSMADASRAGLGGRGPWRQYPRAMLFARAISEGARTHCPDLFGGAPVYTPEELGAEVDGEGNLIAAPPPPPPPPPARSAPAPQYAEEGGEEGSVEGATPKQLERLEQLLEEREVRLDPEKTAWLEEYLAAARAGEVSAEEARETIARIGGWIGKQRSRSYVQSDHDPVGAMAAAAREAAEEEDRELSL